MCDGFIMANIREVIISPTSRVKLVKVCVQKGQSVKKDSILAIFIYCDKKDGSDEFISQHKLKAKYSGTVVDVAAKINDEIEPGHCALKIEEDQCSHATIMKEMCCDCGADLRKEPGIPGDLLEPVAASIAMVHNIPELRVSIEEAEKLAKKDERQLLKARKLALVVDLDQTLIHTTVEQVPMDIKDLFHFNLPGHQFQYHTKLRPGAKRFLEAISQYYELHIFTMGSRMYAHTIAKFLDPDEKLFAHRIRSRDECFNAFSKSQDLRSLFPCGDHMVCIIDDREDIWNFVPNLVTVKPYRYFTDVGDINSPFQPLAGNGINKGEATVTQSLASANPDQMISTSKDSGDQNEEDQSGGQVSTDVVNNKKGGDTSSNAERSKLLNMETTENGLTTTESNNTDPIQRESSDEKVGNVDEETKVSNVEREEESKELKPAQTKEDSDKKEAENEETAKLEQTVPEIVDTSDLDDYLFYLEDILERIHVAFYSSLDVIKGKGGTAKSDPSITRYCTSGTINPDIRVIVPELKRQTLEGAHLVFTGVVPTNMVVEKSRAWRVATSLGARVTPDIVKSNRNSLSDKGTPTTHVIAARGGTEKARKASKLVDVKLVNPNWLWCCNERWEWLEERLFPVSNPEKNSSESTPVSSRQGTPVTKMQRKTAAGVNADERTELIDQDNSVPLSEKAFSALITFSTNEVEEMDREVEELMQSEQENESDTDQHQGELDCFQSVSTSSHSQNSPCDFAVISLEGKDDKEDDCHDHPKGKLRHGRQSSEIESSGDSSVETDDSSSESDRETVDKPNRKRNALGEIRDSLKRRKRKRGTASKKKSTSEGHSENYFPNLSSESDSSTTSSDTEMEEEDMMARMLERQISGSPYPD